MTQISFKTCWNLASIYITIIAITILDCVKNEWKIKYNYTNEDTSLSFRFFELNL